MLLNLIVKFDIEEKNVNSRIKSIMLNKQSEYLNYGDGDRFMNLK
jgi:hypothetical protein